jgi:hypothetical protein
LNGGYFVTLVQFLQVAAWPLVCLIVIVFQFLVNARLRRRVERLGEFERWYYDNYDQFAAHAPSSRPLGRKPLPARRHGLL